MVWFSNLRQSETLPSFVNWMTCISVCPSAKRKPSSKWKFVAKHSQAASGLFLPRFILKHIPVFLKIPVVDAQDVGSNPIRGRTPTAISPVNRYIVAFSHNHNGLVLQCGRSASYQVEQALTAWFDMSTVLNVVRRPVAFCLLVVAFVEQTVERFQNQRSVLRFDRRTHSSPLSSVMPGQYSNH